MHKLAWSDGSRFILEVGQDSYFCCSDHSWSGVSMFIIEYDPSGQAIEWEKNDISRIYRLSHIYDKI